MADSPAAVPADTKPQQPVDGTDALAPVGAVERKLIQHADLQLEVKAYADARQAVDAAVARAKGYVANAKIDHAEGQVSRAELSLRVPAEQLANVLAEFKQLGTVLHESLETEDITEAYVDLQARLGNARKLEARLLELLASETKDVKDLLEVERELSRVRESLERLEGKLKLYDRQVAMSTITLRLLTVQTYQASKPRGLGEQLSHTLGESWRSLVGFGRGLLVVLVALLPWLPLLGAAGWLGWRLLRWLNRRFMATTRSFSAVGPYGQATWMGQPVGRQPPDGAQSPPGAAPVGVPVPSGAQSPPGAAPVGDLSSAPGKVATNAATGSAEPEGKGE